MKWPAILALLLLAGAYDPDCYRRCMREGCRSACADDADPEACKACLKAYDSVCVEQCTVKPPPPPSNRLAECGGVDMVQR